MGLSSQQVLSFMPLNTWTPVFIISNNESNNNGIYIVSTEDKLLKRCEDMYKITLNIYTFEKVSTYQLMGLVAVEIKGLWCRGRMLSFNEYLFKNTAVELIDLGFIVKKQLCDLYQLPDSYKYDPLCLAIKPISEIIFPKLRQFCVQPLLLQSELEKGYVVVNIKPIDIFNECNSEVTFEKSLRSITEIPNSIICTIKKSKYNIQNNLVIKELNRFKNFQTYVEEPDFEYKYVIKLSNELKEVFNTEKKIHFKDLLYNVNKYRLNNTCIQLISSVPKGLSLKYIDLNDNSDIINKVTEFEQCNINNMINTKSSAINDSYTNDVDITEHDLFKNGSSVEFCCGTNIDFVYIRSYEEKKKYSYEMKMFYTHYIKKYNIKIKTELNKGDLVAALSHNYKKIHRAVILHKNKEKNNFYLCFFVDLGHKEYVNSNNIFEILDEVKNIPYLAHKVRLKNDPYNNTMKLKYLKKYFAKLYLQPLIIEFDELNYNGFNKVILKNKLNNMNIYFEINELIHNTVLSNKLSNNGAIEPNIVKYLNYNDVFKNGTVVIITHFDSIHKVYVRIGTFEIMEYYDKLIMEFHKFYDNIKSLSKKININIGETVSVRSPSKNKFSRAIIMKKIDNTTYLVYYIDYGIEECVKTNNIFFLSRRFYHLPRTVIKIGLNVFKLHLHNIKMLDNYFKQLIQFSTPLIAEFDEDDPLSFQNVVLKKNGVNILCNTLLS